MEKKKIAVCSPDITNLGGVSRCVVVLINALNKRGIVPDYYGIRSDKEKVKELFNREIEYNFKKILWPNKAILYSSWMKNFQLVLKRYDFVFDFTNTLPFFNMGENYFSYILYPEFLTSRGKYNKGIWRFYYAPHQILAYFQKGKFQDESNNVACVSKKISDLLYERFGRTLPVLYPPANIEDFKNTIVKKKGVISVGGFSHEKNQLEQIRIAKRFPRIKFKICGNAKRNPSYSNLLVGDAKKHPHIEIWGNLPFKELKKKLVGAEVFLHTSRNEPFGMAVVEAISAGCIPLIHNSGGVVEIVPFKDLRYKSEREAVKKLRKILNLNKRQKRELRKKLNKHINKFREENFVKELFNLTLDKRKI